MLRTLAARLSVYYAGIFLFFFAAAFLFFYYFINATLVEQIDDDLEEDIVEFGLFYENEGLSKVIAEIEREVASNEPNVLFLRLLDGGGNIVYSSDTGHWPALEQVGFVSGLLDEEGEPGFLDIQGQGDEHATRMVTGQLTPDLYLQIGETMEDKEEFMALLLNVFAATFLVVVMLSMLVGWFMARRALQGVEEVTHAAEDVAKGSLDREVTVKAQGEEIERLVGTFNVMVKKISALVSGMREMTDNIAHDMRSPLARIRSNSELTLYSAETVEDYRLSAAETLEECDRLLQMINTTLDVAEAEAGIAELDKEEVDLSSTVRDACDLFDPIAENREIELTPMVEADQHVWGNIQHLQRMLANLLDNALKYTPRKGQVSVALFSDDRSVSVSVRDTGVGISKEEQSHIFDRFFRCDQSRTQPGFGLGLSFSRAVARAHGGELSVYSEPGNGSIFTVTLPRYQ